MIEDLIFLLLIVALIIVALIIAWGILLMIIPHGSTYFTADGKLKSESEWKTPPPE